MGDIGVQLQRGPQRHGHSKWCCGCGGGGGGGGGEKDGQPAAGALRATTTVATMLVVVISRGKWFRGLCRVALALSASFPTWIVADFLYQSEPT